MAASRHRASDPGVAEQGRLTGPPVRTIALLLLPLLLVALVAVARVGLVTGRPTIVSLTGADDATPEQLTASAADTLEAATAGIGGGYTFEIIQSAEIVYDDGSESHQLGTYLERGHATPAGYYAEVRRGPDDGATKPDFEAGAIELQALVRDGLTWRNDGAGWYQTDQPPGLGLDPTTAALLPTLLRESTDVTDTTEPGDAPTAAPTSAPDEPGADEAAPSDGAAPADPDAAVEDPTPTTTPSPQRQRAAEAQVVRTLEATAEVADIPGIIAVDLAASTELLEPIEFAFDDDGRLVRLTVVARNTRLEADLLRVTTTITFDYPLLAPSLPDPTTDLAPADQPVEGES